jgi:hypothetical protein
LAYGSRESENHQVIKEKRFGFYEFNSTAQRFKTLSCPLLFGQADVRTLVNILTVNFPVANIRLLLSVELLA